MKAVTISSRYQVVFIPYERRLHLLIVPPIKHLTGIDTDPQCKEENEER